MFGANQGEQPNPFLDGSPLRIGIAQARFNAGITSAMLAACLAELEKWGVQSDNIVQHSVAGALEVPSMLQAMANKGRFDALIALGCVIRGETYHFELVCNESAAGVTRVTLDTNIPVANAILTVENMEQAIARQSDKAADAARVAIEMANRIASL